LKNLFSVKGKKVLITGGSRGIGYMIAHGFLEHGAHVYIASRKEDELRAAAEKLSELGPCVAFPADISSGKAARELAAKIEEREGKLDVLVNNAGANWGAPYQEYPESAWDRVLSLNVKGVFELTQACTPLLEKAAVAHGGARVVNVLSGGMYSQRIHVDDLESRSGAYSGSVAYARAKRGLMILTEEWARRWATDGIVVNAMHPGWADTPGVVSSLPEFHRVTERVLRTPEEGADTIVWLASATEAGKVSGKFWLDREPHLQHVLPNTRETSAERRRLLQALASYARKRRKAA